MCSTMTIGGMGETTVRELLWHSLIDTYLIPIKTFLGRALPEILWTQFGVGDPPWGTFFVYKITRPDLTKIYIN